MGKCSVETSLPSSPSPRPDARSHAPRSGTDRVYRMNPSRKASRGGGGGLNARLTCDLSFFSSVPVILKGKFRDSSVETSRLIRAALQGRDCNRAASIDGEIDGRSRCRPRRSFAAAKAQQHAHRREGKGRGGGA